MNKKEVTAVLFDWDFTLAYTLEENLPHMERIAALFQREGLPYSVEDIRSARKRLLCDIAWGKTDGTIKPQTKQEIIHLYQQLLTRLGHADAGDELAYRLYTGYAQLPTTLYDDVLPTLQALARLGLKLGILSNHSTSVRRIVEKLVGDYISSEHMTISEEVGRHKPDKRIFQRAAECLHVPPDQCLYVGDNLNVDAIGAVAQGGFAWGLWLDRANKGTAQDMPEKVVRITLLQQVLDYTPFALPDVNKA